MSRPQFERSRRPQPSRTRGSRIHREPSLRGRLKSVMVILVLVSVVIIGRLGLVQIKWGPGLAERALQQRTYEYQVPARRGSIVDREGRTLAFTMQARSLTVSPHRLHQELAQQERLKLIEQDKISPDLKGAELEKTLAPLVDARLTAIAEGIPAMIKNAGGAVAGVNSTEILTKLRSDTTYQNLVHNVDPDVAVEIAKKFPGVGADHQDIRQYPNGAIAENLVGKVGTEGIGQFGLEALWDGFMRGSAGKSIEEISATGQVIPGTFQDVTKVVHGDNLELSLDLSLQTFVQQKLEKAVANSKAKSGDAVVLDAATGEILAMANSGTIDPNKNIQKQLDAGKHFENRSVSHPFEPGSVAKIITAAAAIEEGLTNPDEVLQVPGSINMAGVTVRDAWTHGVEPYTTTGVFGKSSNVGTLLLAQRLGKDKFAHYLEEFGLGRVTGVELPNESAGIVPDRAQWSGGTFANLPIGQGMSWTALQMASVYQTIANNGKRIEPRLVKAVKAPDGQVLQQDAPATTQVISPQTAATVRNMFRAAFQSDPAGVQNGTAANASLPGYQLSGKTGTAQQVDETTGGYSNSKYWITFAGMAPAEQPRFVISIMLDRPQSGVNDNGSGGQSAAPVFRDIAQWLLDRDNIPPSPPAPRLTLRAG